MSILDYIYDANNYKEHLDSERDIEIPMTDEEEIAAQGEYDRWKQGNRKIEEDIDRFMRNKIGAITAIMELSDRMRVVNGDKVVIEDKKKEEPRNDNSEEIRLLKEQNALLKELLLKNTNNNEYNR